MKRITAFFPRLVNHIVALVVMLSAGILATTLAGAAPTPGSLTSQAILSSPTPHVRLAPNSLQVNVGDQFSIQVLIDNASYLGGYEFKLRYNPSIVQVADTSDGEFLASRGASVFSITPRIDNEVGELVFASVILGIGQNPAVGVQGTGRLAVVEMEAIGEGTTTLDLQGVKLVDTHRRSWTPASIAGSRVAAGLPGTAAATAVPPTPYVPTPTPVPRSQLTSTDPRETQLTFEGFAFLPVWSPDGSKIAFERSTGVVHGPTKAILHEVWIMNADGSGQRKLADSGRFPTFSPDGQYLLYTRLVDRSRSELWTVNINGRDQRKLVDTDGGARLVSWLPDGSIAFTQDGLFKMLTAAGQVQVMSNSVELKGNPVLNSFRLSPDGSKIAYHQARVLRVMTTSGEHLATITTDLDPGLISYAWSPDSQKLVYVTGHGGPQPEFWVSNADGTAPKRLVSGNREHIERPVWSPDGTTIAFTRRMTGSQTAPSSEIYFVHPDGSGLRRVTNNKLNEGFMAWSPDGTKIAFTRLEMGTVKALSQTIWVINVGESLSE